MSSETGEIRLDVTESEDLRTAEILHDGRLGDVAVDSVWLTESKEPNKVGGFALEKVLRDPLWSLSLDAGNYITCEGELPFLALPEPYPVSGLKIFKTCARFSGLGEHRKSSLSSIPFSPILSFQVSLQKCRQTEIPILLQEAQMQAVTATRSNPRGAFGDYKAYDTYV